MIRCNKFIAVKHHITSVIIFCICFPLILKTKKIVEFERNDITGTNKSIWHTFDLKINTLLIFSVVESF